MNARRIRRPSSVRIGMFCRFGSVRRQPAGGGDGLVERGVDAAVVGDRLEQAVDRGLELGHVAVAQQVLQHRVAGLREQALQRVGVGGVAGLDPLGLGQAALGEQDLLQLLGRAEVELAADHLVRGLLRRPSPRRRSAPPARTGSRCRRRCRRAPSRRAPPTSGSSTSASSRCEAPSSRDSSSVERVGQVEGGPGAQHHVLLGGALVAEAVEGELAVVRRVRPAARACR